MVFSTFLIGSNRYRDCFTNYFPPILHSTREILNFLHKYVENRLTFENNVEFGDALHPLLRRESLEFLQNNSLRDCDTVVLEISSRKVAYVVGSDTPLNVEYVQYYGSTDYDIKYLTDEEIRKDIREIQEVLKTLNVSRIVILTNINLRLRDTNHYVPERLKLYKQLVSAKGFVVVDVSKFIEQTYKHIYLDDVLTNAVDYKQVVFSYIRDSLAG